MPEKRKCFVVMGFGEKIDLATGRTLDLDKTHRTSIIGGGTYEWLLSPSI
ncbi:MAG: hypothetical protein M3P06_00105 [Acidobacteriota bacterium]|nr:hypothetical protein [Acidobacteriota bacterium]